MNILITGVAGFVGSNLTEHLLNQNHKIIGVDNFDEFYSKEIKTRNLNNFIKSKKFSFYEEDILNFTILSQIIQKESPELIIHLAAKAGVRPSILDPQGYFNVNVMGTLNVLEAMRISGIKKMIFASSSSVYGNCKVVPFSESMNVDFPISPYATTKKAGELLCHTYHHLYSMDIFCLRFFTVYGPRQRPDLAIHKFTKALIEEKEIQLFGDGSTRRDYTHINDIIQGIDLSVKNCKGFQIINLGESQTISLNDLILLLEKATSKTAKLNYLPFQEGDVLQTHADISKAQNLLGYSPQYKLKNGIIDFVKWYKKNCIV